MKKLVFTFDDGMKSNYDFTAPVLKVYGFKGTFFYCHKRMWGGTELAEPQMTLAQLRDLDQRGFEIGNHTLDHTNLATSSVWAIKQQVRELDVLLIQNGITQPSTLAYPAYRSSILCIQALKELGYKYARAGYQPNEPNGEHFEKELQFTPDARKYISYYDPKTTNPLRVHITGNLAATDVIPIYTPDHFARDLAGCPEGCVAVFGAHGMPNNVPVRQTMFLEMCEYAKKNGWQGINFRDM